MLELFIANKNYSSWSLRPWVLMRELGIPFEEHFHEFVEGSRGDAFRSFSPSGKVPCLRDGELVVWDSLAIVEYLAEKYEGVWPKDPAARAWARSAAAEMHSGFGALRSECSMNCGVRVRLHAMSPDLLRDIRRLDELFTEGLRRFGGPLLTGKAFTAADAFYAPVAFRVQTFGLPLSEAALGYTKELLLRPAMQAWYEAALRETYRERMHEDEVKQAGTWTADYRIQPI